MIIHVVQQGETINSIAQNYGISELKLIRENEITNPYKLVVGEALVILYPQITYTVKEGDTLEGIADTYGVNVMQLLRNNPYLSNREFIYPSETLVISYEGNKIMKISTNGYAYPFIDKEVLKKTLPYLTYLTIYSYLVTAEGEINTINDTEIIQIAKEYGVAPIMMLTGFGRNLTEGINVTHTVLLSQEKQDYFINNLLIILKTKGYYGVNITTSYILPEDRILYIDFITKFTNRIKSEGYKVFDTLSLSAFEIITSTIYKGLEYAKIGQVVDGAMIMSYEWGSAIGIPTGIIAFDTVRKLIDSMTEQIPPEKIYIGAPSIGYVWQLPYDPSTSRGQSISYNSAKELASQVDAIIQYDTTTKSSYFQYIYISEYIVRFRDARSIDDYVKLIPEFGLNGIDIWNIMIYFPQLWLVINSQYEIDKII